MPRLSKPVKVETITTGVTCGADVDLIGQVRRRVRLEGTNQDGQYTVVFCPIASRVGSDVEAAMQNVPSNKKVVLVLMHHTRDPDYSTAGRSWSDVYPNVDLEVHVLFHESVPGLLTCSQNADAVYQMQEYLQPSRNDLQPSRNYLQPSRNDLQPSRNYLQPSRNYLQPSRNYLQPSRNDSQLWYMILLGLVIIIIVLFSLLFYVLEDKQKPTNRTN